MSPEKLLIVEGDWLLAESMARFLRGRGFEVCLTQKDGRKALALAREYRPDLVLMDPAVKEEPGHIEIARRLKAELDVSVLFLSEHCDKELLEKAKKASPLGFITKPLDEGNLLSAIEIAIHKSRIDRDLRRTKDWYAATLHSLDAGVIAIGRDREIRFINKTACRMTGWRLQEAMGQPISKIYCTVSEGDREKRINPVIRALAQKELVVSTEPAVLIPRDGGQILVDDSGAPIQDANGRFVGAVLHFRDTKAKATRDKEIRDYQQRLEELVEERTIALERRVELERLVIRISTDLIRLDEDNGEEVLTGALRQIGEELGFDVCALLDIDNRAEKKEKNPYSVSAVWHREEDLLALTRLPLPAPEEFREWNRQLEKNGRLVVHCREELRGGSSRERLLMESAGVEGLIVLPLGATQPIRKFLLLAAEQPKDWDSDDIVLLEMTASVFKNVLERREMDRERVRLREQLNQSQKVEAIGKLTGGIAHDFNNMLVPILGYTESLLSDRRLVEGREEIREIRNAAQSAASLTRQLLAFSRKQVLHKTRLSLNEVIGGMKGLLKRLLSEDVMLSFRLADNLWPLEADRGQIEQVVMNLCINGRDAMKGVKGGLLTVETMNYEDSREGGGPFAVIRVADTGCGIPRELLDQIFEPFFSTKGDEGTGLGLAVVLGIVEQHGGWVRVESKEGQGTRFYIGLPAIPEAAGRRNGGDRLEPDFEERDETMGSGERILLVEDEPAVVQFVTRALHQHGYRVVTAPSVAGAFKTFEKEREDFDLIFTDAMLPDGTGMEVIREIRTLKPSIKALISSGYTDDRAQNHQAGGEGVRFLQKPYELNRLYEAVFEVLNGVTKEPEEDVTLNS